MRLPAVVEPGQLAEAAEAIGELCAAEDLDLVGMAHDVEPPHTRRRARPGLRWALEELEVGRAGALVVAELHHLCDTVADLAAILGWFEAHDRRLVAIDLRIDTATAAGRVAGHALIDVGRWERARVAARTHSGLEAAHAGSLDRGRPAVADMPALRDRILRLRSSGMSLQAIADLLNAEGVPTLRGGALWRPSSIQAVTGYRRPSAGGWVDLPRDVTEDGA